MLYNLLTSYADTYSFLNFFNFLTVRTGLAVLTAMTVVFLIGDKFINYFSTKKIKFLWEEVDPLNQDLRCIPLMTIWEVQVATVMESVQMFGRQSSPMIR